MVVGVFPRQDAGSTGAAQRAGDVLRGRIEGKKKRKCGLFEALFTDFHEAPLNVS